MATEGAAGDRDNCLTSYETVAAPRKLRGETYQKSRARVKAVRQRNQDQLPRSQFPGSSLFWFGGGGLYPNQHNTKQINVLQGSEILIRAVNMPGG
jgi:hypothetical protein